jgi:hypothetical protein
MRHPAIAAFAFAFVLLFALAAAPTPARADWRTFLFAADGTTLDARRAAVETGVGYNGLPGEHVVLAENQRRIDAWLAASVGLAKRLELDAAVAFADGPGAYDGAPGRPFGFGWGRVELRAEALAPRARLPLSIALGGGYQVDAAAQHAVTGLVAVTLDVSRVRITANVRGAHYFHEGRDPIDISVAAGISIRATRLFRVGAEYVGEELEGVSDPDEADTAGGGRHYVGPSAQLSLIDNRLRLSATVGPVFANHSIASLARAGVSWLF